MKKRFRAYKALKKDNFTVYFPNEGNLYIKLPKFGLIKNLTAANLFIDRNFDYAKRSNAECLLRKCVYEMYENGFIRKDKSIIDIGSYIGDNAVIWATFLDSNARVLAVDPSQENNTYGKKVAELNSTHNIDWVEAVCAKESGMKMYFKGSLHHAKFSTEKTGSYLESKTLDQLFWETRSNIGLLHIDVEGSEFSVLQGARGIISLSTPVILFEQHISSEDPTEIIQFLKEFGYRTFMLNEVLPDCALDCRNFISLPKGRTSPPISEFDISQGKDFGIFSATVGNSLIDVESYYAKNRNSR